MNRKDAVAIIQNACKTKTQKKAFALLFATEEHCEYKCGYYHEICRHCLNWPSPDDIANDDADDGCRIYEMAAYLHDKCCKETHYFSGGRNCNCLLFC